MIKNVYSFLEFWWTSNCNDIWSFASWN